MPRDPFCTSCPLHSTCMTVCLWGTGPAHSPLMVVGEAPGYHEDKKGKPFVGKSGDLLRAVLEAVGLRDYYITNAVKCRPPENKLPSGSKALKQVLDACKPYLLEEIEQVRPKFILALGNTPLKSLTGHSGITKWRGTPIEADFGYGPVKVFPAYHPAYVLRGPGLEKMFKVDLHTLAGMVSGVDGSDFWKDMKTRVIKSRDGLNDILAWHPQAVGEGFVQVYDLETFGFYTEKGKYVSAVECPPELGDIVWAGVAYHHEDGRNVQFIIPWEHKKAKSTWRKAVQKVLKLILEDSNIKRIAQHGKYDDRWLSSRDIIPVRSFDTMNAAYLLDENIPHYLATIGRIYLGAPTWDDIAYEQLHDLSFSTVVNYLSRDLYVTGRAYFALRKRLATDQGLARVFKHIIMPGDQMLTRAQRYGVPVRKDVLLDKLSKFEHKVKETEDKLNKLSPIGPINWNSVPQKVRLLFSPEGLNLTPIKLSKTGGPSTDKDVLAQLEEDLEPDTLEHQVVSGLREYQKYRILLSFLNRWRDKLNLAESIRGESRIYTEFNIARTSTGRLSAVDPDGTGDNLQQVPSRGPGAELRHVFGPPPGWKLINADYSQIELRWVAMVGPEPTMQKLFKEGIDQHTYTAAHLLGKRMEDVTKDERKRAKAVNFGFLYKMQAPKFVRYALTEYGVKYTLRDAKRAQRGFYELYPGLPDYYRRTEDEVRSTGQVRTAFGRIRRLPDVYSPDEFKQEEAIRQAINAKIQSPASDMTVMAAIMLGKLLPPDHIARIILLVHDSIMIEVKEEYADEVANLVKKVMEQDVVQFIESTFGFKFTVPIVADVTVESYWGEKD